MSGCLTSRAVYLIQVVISSHLFSVPYSPLHPSANIILWFIGPFIYWGLALPCAPVSHLSPLSCFGLRTDWRGIQMRRGTHQRPTASSQLTHPLNPSTTNQRRYIMNSAHRAGWWRQKQYCFHLRFSEVKRESHLLRCQDCQRMTNDSDTINHFHLSFHSKVGRPASPAHATSTKKAVY